MLFVSLLIHGAAMAALWREFIQPEQNSVVEISLLPKVSPVTPVQKALKQAGLTGPKASGSSVQTWPELVSQPRVEYPPTWRDRNVSGMVKAKLKISSLGQVEDIHILQSDSSELADLAARAMREFRFRPASHEGKAVASEIEYSYRFVLR